MFRTYRISAVVCALFVAACGGGGDTAGTGGAGSSDGTGGAGGAGGGTTTTTGGGPATVDAACAALAKANCAKFGSCAPFLRDTLFTDEATCVARGTIACKSEFSAAEAAKTNAAKLASCATWYGTATCGDILNEALPTECRPDPGTLAEGKACGSDAQCVSTFCKKDTAADCGVCAAKVPAGGDCVASACGDGLACLGGKCRTPGAEGAACSDMQPCGALLSCNNMKCGAPAKIGEACSGAGDSCDITVGALCSPFSNKCEAIKAAKAGEACGFISNAFVLCTGGATCNTGMMTMGTCVAPAADGAACDKAKSIGCLSGANCVNSVCTVFDAATCK